MPSYIYTLKSLSIRAPASKKLITLSPHQLATAGYCPSCDPKQPQYFQETEKYAQCVYEETQDEGKTWHDWQIVLPNDHIWSGQEEHGTALEGSIRWLCNSAKGGLENVEAFPVDEYGTVDMTFRADVVCEETIEKMMFLVMKGRVKVECKKMPSDS